MCGAAPVTRASGRSRTVGFRYTANKQARVAITSFADNSPLLSLGRRLLPPSPSAALDIPTPCASSHAAGPSDLGLLDNRHRLRPFPAHRGTEACHGDLTKRAHGDQWSQGEGGDEVSVARFIADQRASHRVPHALSCRLLGVSESWFYKWIERALTRRGCIPRPIGAVPSWMRRWPRRSRPPVVCTARRGWSRICVSRGGRSRRSRWPPRCAASTWWPPDQAPQRLDQAGQDCAEVR